MGTRSLVGVVNGELDFRAAYVHYDGYPSGVGVELAALIARDGLPTVLDTVLGRFSWASIEHAATVTGRRGRAELAGYGEYHTDTDSLIEGNLATDHLHGFAGTEWAYLFTGLGEDAALLVLNRAGSPLVRVPVALLPRVTYEGWRLLDRNGNLSGGVALERLVPALPEARPFPALPSGLLPA